MNERGISLMDMARWEHEWQHLNGQPCACEAPEVKPSGPRHAKEPVRVWDRIRRASLVAGGALAVGVAVAGAALR